MEILITEWFIVSSSLVALSDAEVTLLEILLVIPCLFTQYGKIPMDGCCIT